MEHAVALPSVEKSCACKGIRTCYSCETSKDIQPVESCQSCTISYLYCTECKQAWQTDQATTTDLDRLLDCVDHVGEGISFEGIQLMRDFISLEEERELCESIDRKQWVESQSGRRKQDFGPKVNFKKKKLKLEGFEGLPSYCRPIIERFAGALDDFYPVELCNLEYQPARGSAITPHFDDFWLWGERLITLNLLSSTFLTFTPGSQGVGEVWSRELGEAWRGEGGVEPTNRTATCEATGTENRNMEIGQCEPQLKVTVDASKSDDICRNISKTIKLENGVNRNSHGSNCAEETQCGDCVNSAVSMNPAVNNCDENCERLNVKSLITTSNITNETFVSECNNKSDIITCKGCQNGHTTVQVLVPMPRRSLIVVSGCARYDWMHSVQRDHVTDRRLAMTFRELTGEFLEGGASEMIGRELLRRAELSAT